MRRGFKAWCERAAADYRRALGVPPTGPLDPRRLAAHLKVRVTPPHGIPTLSPSALRQLTEVDPGSWSAVTLVRDDARLVILNSAHSEARQRSSLAHELAHLLLNHTADRALLPDAGLLFRSSFDREQEEEAAWFAGCLLAPREGLVSASRRSPSEKALAARFEVSEALIGWRLGTTGVLRQIRRGSGPSPMRRTARTSGTRGAPIAPR